MRFFGTLKQWWDELWQPVAVRIITPICECQRHLPDEAFEGTVEIPAGSSTLRIEKKCFCGSSEESVFDEQYHGPEEKAAPDKIEEFADIARLSYRVEVGHFLGSGEPLGSYEVLMVHEFAKADNE